MYETIVVLNPNTTNEDIENKISDWTQLIKEFGAETKRVERWGKRNLAFEIKKFHQGIFIIFHIDGKNDAIVELERRFKIAEDVIRYQTVKLSALEYQMSNELLESLKTRQNEESPKTPTKAKALDDQDLDDDDEDSDIDDDDDDDDDDDVESQEASSEDEDFDSEEDDTDTE